MLWQTNLKTQGKTATQKPIFGVICECEYTMGKHLVQYGSIMDDIIQANAWTSVVLGSPRIDLNNIIHDGTTF